MGISNGKPFNPADIKKIVCRVSYMYPRTVVYSQPVKGLQGKTSLQYCVALGLTELRPTQASFEDAAVNRPEWQDLMRRIEVVVPPELSENVPAVKKAPFEQPLTVTVYTNDGRTLSNTYQYLKGSPQNPASNEDLESKFFDCVTPHLGKERAHAVAAYLGKPDSSVRGLFLLLAPNQ